MMQDHPLLIHHHITKSGGTTFNKSVLPAWFGQDSVLLLSRTATSNPDARQRWRAAGPQEWNGLYAAAGHDFVGVGEQSGRRLIKFAFFRDPINRAASKWYHHLNKAAPSGNMRRLIERHNGDVCSYLLEAELSFDYFRAFLPLELHIAYHKSVKLCSSSDQFVQRYPELWKAMLDKAIHNMASLDYMFITERFEDSIKILAGAINKPVPKLVSHRVGKIPIDVSNRIRLMRPELEARQVNAYALMKIVHAKFKRQLDTHKIESSRVIA